MTFVRIKSVFDIRPIDFSTGKRLDIPRDEWFDCNECGAKHARVYELSDGRTVGRNCALRLAYGVTKAFDQAEERRLLENAAKDEARRLVPELLSWRPTVKRGIADEMYQQLKLKLPFWVFHFGGELIVNAWVDHHKALGNITTVDRYYVFKEVSI